MTQIDKSNPALCPCCGNKFDLEDPYECENCSTKVCEECKAYCNICGKIYCYNCIDQEGVLRQCSSCEEYFCEDCGTYKDEDDLWVEKGIDEEVSLCQDCSHHSRKWRRW